MEYWLIVKSENGRMKVLTIRIPGGEEVLPVFSFEEEAELFLRLGGCGDGWRTRESEAGEVVSVLYGPCPDVDKVVLDPIPKAVVGEAMPVLVSLSRERFTRDLMRRRWLSSLRQNLLLRWLRT